MRVLALDVGDRRVGIAFSGEAGLIATPLTVIHRTSRAEDFARLIRLMRERGVGKLVIGHPLNDDGSAGPQARRIERYAAALEGALRAEGLDLPIELWDEGQSTQRAQEAMIVAGRRAKDRRTRIDAVAAAVILQDYLDSHRSLPVEPDEEDVS
jgi:putative Holliday junction resolvase